MEKTENNASKDSLEHNVNGDNTDNSADDLQTAEQLADELISELTEDDSKENITTNDAATDAKIAELNDRYLRLYSEFDNYRKRTLKEKSDIIKSAGEAVFKIILPVLDDFDRAIKANGKVEDVAVIKEGMILIYNKLKNNTSNKGLIAFDSLGQNFDPDIMEAVTHIPAQNEEDKNKVIDELEKGYKLGEKVIRFAKVVIAQ
jgi:molecular chaperone GrpE